MVDRFTPFADFLNAKDVSRYKHITSSSGSYAYKVICNMAGLEEIYNDYNIEEDEKFKGASVIEPTVESATGLVVDLDFASLYPSTFIQFNLYSHDCTCCTEEEKFAGNAVFKVRGKYCAKEQGVIENVIKRLYQMRKEFKKNKDNREYVVKIIINVMYGISGNRAFANLYKLDTASDCTGLGQQQIKYARKRLEQGGYKLLYSDTDSAFVLVPTDKTINDLKVFARQICEEIKSNVPFPWEEFDFKIDATIKYICFFKGKGDSLNMKNYLFVDTDNNLQVTGLQVIKKNCSKLSVEIFEKELKHQIIANLDCKFDKTYIVGLIKEYLTKDISLAAVAFNVKKDYKSKTSIQNQIYEMFGEGEHLLIKNYKVGTGKSIKYCKIEEAVKLKLSDLDIDIFMSELGPFIKKYQTNTGGNLEGFI
jgi:DNA polymerase elongation subunit (family B)